MSFILFENVHKEYGTGDSIVRALNDTNFSVEQGELAVILGSSGAGKTTALNIPGGMDTATRGRVIVKKFAGFYEICNKTRFLCGSC